MPSCNVPPNAFGLVPVGKNRRFPYLDLNKKVGNLNLFKKHKRPEDLGAMLYEALRGGMEGGDDLSLAGFITSLDRAPEDLEKNYHGEVMVGLMFAAGLAVERSASAKVANRILSGMKAEMLNHLEEQGANLLQRTEWEAVVASRFLVYRKCLEDYSGFEPPWKLGREFFWNVIGEEEQIAMSIKIATLYLMEGQSLSQKLVNTYGPTLLVSADA